MCSSVSKTKLRHHYSNLRSKQLPSVEADIIKQVKKLLTNLLTRGKLKGYLGIYWPLPGEVDLRAVKLEFDILLALPATSKDRSISYRPWTLNPLRNDSFKIPAPLDEPALKPEDMSLLLVPALAIDSNGIRLGYGAGCFDRLRRNSLWRSIPAMAVVPKACITSNLLPSEEWDIPFNGWINENGNTIL